MKVQFKVFVIALITASISACSSNGEKTEATEAKAPKNETYNQVMKVNTAQSNVAWQGYKPTGTHNGTVSVSEGSLQLEDGNLVGGKFTINMNSIVVEDVKDPESKAKLLGHLQSADFFEVATYPTATFEITDVKAISKNQIDKTKEKGLLVPTHAITGNLSLKDQTKSITFNALIKSTKNSITAETNQFFINRVQWNVQYGSKTIFKELKDKFINDEMGINIELSASRQE